ncbi:MAG: family 10 glycosylhydrolase [Armatimonadetes bacterium]|nr:family 10 glycosylhydrolase [Armatimonadota bacterium]
MTRTSSVLQIIVVSAVLALCLSGASTATADEYRAWWVDAWGPGFLDQSQVDKLLGVVGSATQKGDIREANCNMVVVQVRRRSDVCYPSGMGEPYFSGLSPANFNALQAMINAAHDTTGGKQRIEVHCWIVPFRTAGGAVYEAHNDPPTGSLINLDNYWPTRNSSGSEVDAGAFDPGHPLCLDYLTDVCMDLVTNFDIDGLHYDYIRFQGNTEGYNPTSVARYNARYNLTGQPAYTNEQWQQWRRDQVTALVRRVYAKVQSVKPQVKISGSFVTWNPSPTASTRAAFMATRPYYDVYSDWDSWMQEGIVDMGIPMTYYDLALLPGDYLRWINFEKDRKFNRHMIVGVGVYHNVDVNDAIEELLMTRTASPAGNYADGWCGYSYRAPWTGGTWDAWEPLLLSEVTPAWASIPSMPWKTSPAKGHVSGTVTSAADGKWVDGATVTIAGPDSRSMICDGTGFYAFIDLMPGSYTVTASKSGYPNAQSLVTVAVGEVTGNMYVRNLTLGDQPVPQISNVQATGVTNNAATITWTTNLVSSSQVEYGTTSAYGSSSSLDITQVTSHSVALTGLNQSTLYHYRVISANANGSSTSADYTFTTLGPPSIIATPMVATTATTATIAWTTNVASSGLVNYGLTSSYGSQAADSNSSTTSHAVTVTGLTPLTTYHYQCVSANTYGSAQTIDATFITASTTEDVIIDNLDPGWTNTSPGGNAWSVGSVAEVPKIGTNYLYRAGDGSLTESSVTRKCRWTPNLAVAGYYDVYAFYQKGTNRNNAAPYTTYYHNGSVTSFQDQYSVTPNQGGWFLIGQHLPFQAGTSGYVELTTLSLDTRYVSADAVKWVFKGSADSTAPVMTSVSDDLYTTSTTVLEASWAAAEPESGIARYDYAVGTSPGSVNVKSWTSSGTATSATITGLVLTVGSTYYISVRAVNDFGLVSNPMSSSGVTVAYAVSSIAEAKGLPNNTPVSIPTASVSSKFAAAFYMQDCSRASGIRVESAVGPAPNYTVQVSGRIRLVNACERALVFCKIVPGVIGDTVEPLMMNHRWVGGSPFGSYAPGMAGAAGLNNVGLLVSVAGKVTAVLPDGFYLDDGSRLRDDTANSGVKIWTGAGDSAVLGRYSVVTGVVSCRVGSDYGIYPQIMARDLQSH